MEAERVNAVGQTEKEFWQKKAEDLWDELQLRSALAGQSNRLVFRQFMSEVLPTVADICPQGYNPDAIGVKHQCGSKTCRRCLTTEVSMYKAGYESLRHENALIRPKLEEAEKVIQNFVTCLNRLMQWSEYESGDSDSGFLPDDYPRDEEGKFIEPVELISLVIEEAKPFLPSKDNNG